MSSEKILKIKKGYTLTVRTMGDNSITIANSETFESLVDVLSVRHAIYQLFGPRIGGISHLNIYNDQLEIQDTLNIYFRKCNYLQKLKPELCAEQLFDHFISELVFNSERDREYYPEVTDTEITYSPIDVYVDLINE